MTMKRIPNWRVGLGQIIEKAREMRFEWGVFDCALYVCDCIQAITGVDPAESYRGTYNDEAGAARIYGDNFLDFIAGQASSLGLIEVPVTFARRGDLIFIDNNTPQGCVGVVSLDARFASCASASGVLMVPIGKWKRAWRVG